MVPQVRQTPEFTYEGYIEMMKALRDNGFLSCRYNEEAAIGGKSVLLRHDVDFDPSKCVRIAEIEANFGFVSTFFFLLKTSFYNVFSSSVVEVMSDLRSMGHEVGLHFDESRYKPGFDYVSAITREAAILEEAAGFPVTCISMHRPSAKCLEGDWVVPGFFNSYSHDLSKRYTYASDSRRKWKMPILDIINGRDEDCRSDKLHILTHPIWYNDVELDLEQTLDEFAKRQSTRTLWNLSENITRPVEVLDWKTLVQVRCAHLREGEIETQRLVLRPVRLTDAADMFEYASCATTCQFLKWGPYETVAEAASWLRSKLSADQNEELLLGIVERGSKKLIGVVRAYSFDPIEKSADISYILNEKYSGQGFASEAVMALVSELLGEVGAEKVYADVDEKNDASRKLLERLGFRMLPDGLFYVEVKGSNRRHMRYELKEFAR